MKKLVALVLALLMMMTVFVGCGDTDTATPDIADLSDAEVVEDDAADDEEAPNISVIIDPFYDADYNQYQVNMTVDGLTETSGGGEYAAEYTEDMTVEELLKELGNTDFELVDENNGKFLGWVKYNVTSVEDEEGFLESTFTKDSEDILYTTQEMLEYTITEGTTAFVAKWDGTSDDMYEQMGY